MGPTCLQCGAYNTTTTGNKYCQQITCPIALGEFKRRRRKRTSTLEQVYIPRKRAQVAPEPAASPADAPEAPAVGADVAVPRAA